MKNIIWKIWVFLLISSCVTPTYNVVHLDGKHDVSGKGGVYYSLPRTVVVVDVIVDKVQRVKGPYAEFAAKYLGLRDVIMNNNVAFELREITLSSYAEPDPNNYYYIEFDEKYPLKDASFLVGLSEAGLIHSINEEMDDKSFSELILEQNKEISKSLETFSYEYFADNNLVETIDTIIKRVDLDTITIEKMIYKKVMVEKSIEQKAKEAAGFLMKIRGEKFNSITGYAEVNYEKAAIEYMDKKLDELEDEYMKMFTGHSSTKELRYRFTFLPDKSDALGLAPLFKFSGKEGVLPISSKRGSVVYVQVDRKNDTKIIEESITANTITQKENEVHNNGLFYRIPEYMNIKIRYGKKRMADARMLINQYGVVANLPSQNTKIQFYPNSGAIKSIRFE